MELQFEVRKVNNGLDKYDKPFVEVVLRTPDPLAMALGKYIHTQEPMRITIHE